MNPIGKIRRCSRNAVKEVLLSSQVQKSGFLSRFKFPLTLNPSPRQTGRGQTIGRSDETLRLLNFPEWVRKRGLG